MHEELFMDAEHVAAHLGLSGRLILEMARAEQIRVGHRRLGDGFPESADAAARTGFHCLERPRLGENQESKTSALLF